MTDSEKIIRVQKLLNNDPRADQATVTIYLEAAKDTLLETVYPFGVPAGVDGVPSYHEGDQCELAARYFSRQGGMGETVHLENGIHRHWDTPDDADILRRVIPYGKVL